MVALDTVVGVLPGTLPRRWRQRLQHRRVRRRLIRSDLRGYDLGRADGPLERYRELLELHALPTIGRRLQLKALESMHLSDAVGEHPVMGLDELTVEAAQSDDSGTACPLGMVAYDGGVATA